MRWYRVGIRRLPEERRVTFVATWKGGGFKFSSNHGDAWANDFGNGKTDLPISFMRLT